MVRSTSTPTFTFVVLLAMQGLAAAARHLLVQKCNTVHLHAWPQFLDVLWCCGINLHHNVYGGTNTTSWMRKWAPLLTFIELSVSCDCSLYEGLWLFCTCLCKSMACVCCLHQPRCISVIYRVRVADWPTNMLITQLTDRHVGDTAHRPPCWWHSSPTAMLITQLTDRHVGDTAHRPPCW